MIEKLLCTLPKHMPAALFAAVNNRQQLSVIFSLYFLFYGFIIKVSKKAQQCTQVIVLRGHLSWL
jgi:hypothetical protein